MQSNYSVSSDKTRLDLDFIHHYLSTRAYWCLRIPYETVRRSVEHSLCFGVYCDDRQIGFARVITDYATIAYLGDVFIVEEHRGQGLSKQLMRAIMDHPQLQGLRRWILLTRDAHGLYEQFGWQTVPHPERYMEIASPNVYS